MKKGEMWVARETHQGVSRPGFFPWFGFGFGLLSCLGTELFRQPCRLGAVSRHPELSCSP